MEKIPTSDEVLQSLRDHVAAKGAEINEKYGPHIGWNELLKILEDRACVRYPCDISFDENHLQPGEFAFPLPKGERPEDGFTLVIHPYFATQPERVPALALYHLVQVNYGQFVSNEDAETFGAHALGISIDEYYEELCASADEIGGDPEPGGNGNGNGHGCGSGCSCS